MCSACTSGDILFISYIFNLEDIYRVNIFLLVNIYPQLDELEGHRLARAGVLRLNRNGGVK